VRGGGDSPVAHERRAAYLTLFSLIGRARWGGGREGKGDRGFKKNGKSGKGVNIPPCRPRAFSFIVKKEEKQREGEE